MFTRALLAWSLLGILSTGAVAQDAPEPINTDSPSLTNSCHVVPPGTVQVESGVYYLSNRANPPQRGPRGRDDPSADESAEDQFAVPSLFRIGLSSDFELRVSTDILQFQGSDFGYSDLGVGFKYRFLDNPQGWSLALVGNLDLPTGLGDFRGLNYSPSLDLITDYPLDDDTTLVINAAVALEQSGAQGPLFAEYFAGAAVSHDFSQDWGAYLELVATGPGQPQGGNFQMLMDGGLYHTINPDWVLNLAVFRGLSSQGANWGGYVGYGARF